MSNGLPYNGWPSIVRHGRDKHYYHARDKGLLPPATECVGCKDPFLEGPVPYHSEEYGPTLEDYWKSCVALCHRCHAMLHARFLTPNRWAKYVAQAMEGQVDGVEYPQRKQIAALLSKFKNRPDIPNEQMPSGAPEYFRSLSSKPYLGQAKVATLLVTDLATGERVEVPDWTLYGAHLERLHDAERAILSERGVRVDAFLSQVIRLPINGAGIPVYLRLYAQQP